MGPILFIIIISDFGREVISILVSKYAADMKNTLRVSNLTGPENIQYELDKKVIPMCTRK